MRKLQTEQVKTTTLVFNFEDSDFNRLKEQICIVKYRIPAFQLPQKSKNWDENKKEYAKLHNWYRSSCEFPYFVHPTTASIYVGYPSEKDIVDIHDDGNFSVFDDFSNLSTAHFWLKVLMAGYFHKDARFVSNNDFFLDVEKISSQNSGREYRKVIKLTPSEHYQVNTNRHFELFIHERVTRLLKVDFDDRDSRKIPYAYHLSKHGDLVFKQANIKEIKKQVQQGKTISIFEENTYVKYKSRLKFHSIESVEKHEKTRNFKLNDFVGKFVLYLQNLGIDVQSKELILTNPLVDIAKTSKRPPLNFEDFRVHVVDKRFNLSLYPFKTILEVLNNTCRSTLQTDHISLSAELPSDGDNILILMDYDKDDFEEHLQHRQHEDGYKKVKADFPNSPSQGFCINTNYFKNKKDGWEEEEYLTSYQTLKNHKLSNIPRVVDLSRNFQIALQQLFLKWLVAKPVHIQNRLPHYDVIQDKIFVSQRTLLYIEDGTLKFESLTSPQANQILRHYTGIEGFEEIALLRLEYYKYEKSAKFTDNTRLMIAKDFVWEIRELPERVLYHDVSQNLKNREKKHDKHQFQLPLQNDYFTTSQTERYNAFIENEVAEQRISYETLVEKENKKKDTGKYRAPIFSILDMKTEARLVKALRELTGLPIKGKKEGRMFKIHEGVWFDDDRMQYFVGARSGYKYNQDKGFQVRKIIEHKGEFDKSVFFPLLDVEFVRHGGFTVQPYPFNLIKIYNDRMKAT